MLLRNFLQMKRVLASGIQKRAAKVVGILLENVKTIMVNMVVETFPLEITIIVE